ncbi:MAG: hypothetical protein FWD25_05035 [Clostridia bacterium]|nr:hypothetical protein [Clostridia bacterium]
MALLGLERRGRLANLVYPVALWGLRGQDRLASLARPVGLLGLERRGRLANLARLVALLGLERPVHLASPVALWGLGGREGPVTLVSLATLAAPEARLHLLGLLGREGQAVQPSCNGSNRDGTCGSNCLCQIYRCRCTWNGGHILF